MNYTGKGFPERIVFDRRERDALEELRGIAGQANPMRTTKGMAAMPPGWAPPGMQNAAPPAPAQPASGAETERSE